MKLVWIPTGGGYAADGEELSYTISRDFAEWVVSKYRKGVHVRTHNTLTLQGAFARAQVWENNANG